MIHKSKSGKLAYSDKFLSGQDIPDDAPKRDQPKDFSQVVKAAFLMFGLFVALLVASGLHSHFTSGGV